MSFLFLYITYFSIQFQKRKTKSFECVGFVLILYIELYSSKMYRYHILIPTWRLLRNEYTIRFLKSASLQQHIPLIEVF